MLDAQLEHLTAVLRNKRIWALNVGENFQISLSAWSRFTEALGETAVAYLYVSEHHLARTDLKIRMRDAIRINRRCASLLLSHLGGCLFSAFLCLYCGGLSIYRQPRHRNFRRDASAPFRALL
jgi:hypothetical protein